MNASPSSLPPKIDPRWDPPRAMVQHECEATIIEAEPRIGKYSGKGYVACRVRIDTGDYKDRTLLMSYTWLYNPEGYEFYKSLGLPVAADDIQKAVGKRFQIKVELKEYEGRYFNGGRFLKRLD